MLACRFLTSDEFKAAEEARMALAKKREADPAWMATNKVTYGWASLRDVIAPGSMWFSEWSFDPKDPDDVPRRLKALERIANKTPNPSRLSRFYWESWSTTRPPISVLCPNGAEWCVDAVASNGEGWQVTGTPPLITCAPSIDVPGYHGFLGINGAPAGHFTKDLARRGPDGMGLPW